MIQESLTKTVRKQCKRSSSSALAPHRFHHGAAFLSSSIPMILVVAVGVMLHALLLRHVTGPLLRPLSLPMVLVEAAPTTALSGSVTNNGLMPSYQYTAQYAVHCDAATISSYATAATACSSLGSGWALSTIPSAAAQSAISALSTNVMWLAGSDAAVEGEWRWTAGRLANALFYKGQRNFIGGACNIPPCTCESGAYCNWNSATFEPNDGVGSVDDYLTMLPFSQSQTWNDRSGSNAATNCAACERSACNLSLDCNATNTLSVNTSKYFTPGIPCGCVCKHGFSGARCDDFSASISSTGTASIETYSLSQTNPAATSSNGATSTNENTVYTTSDLMTASATHPRTVSALNPTTITASDPKTDSVSGLKSVTASAPMSVSPLGPVTASASVPPPPPSTTATTTETTANTATSNSSSSTASPATTTIVPATTSSTTTTDSTITASTTTVSATSVGETSTAATTTPAETETTTTTTTATATTAVVVVSPSSTVVCTGTPASAELPVVSSEATLILFISSSPSHSPTVVGSTTPNHANGGYNLAFPLPSIATADANANTLFTPVWSVTTTINNGSTRHAATSTEQAEAALAQTLRDDVLPLTQCTTPPPLSQSHSIRCAMPLFSVPQATIDVAAATDAPVRITINAMVSNFMHLQPLPTSSATTSVVATALAACPTSPHKTNATTLLLTATIIVAPPTADGGTGVAMAVLRIALAASGVATTAFAIIAEPWALEPLLLVGVLGSPCADLAGLQGLARFAVYSLNPFVPLTNSAAAGGLLLMLVVGIVTVVNAAVAFARTPAAAALETAAVEDAEEEVPPLPRWRRVFGTALFPRVAFSVAVAAVPGVSWALAATIRGLATPAHATPSYATVSVGLGAVYVILVPAIGALVVLRAAPATFIPAEQWPQRKASSSSSASPVWRWAQRLITPVGAFVPLHTAPPLSPFTGPSAALLPPAAHRRHHHEHRDSQTITSATCVDAPPAVPSDCARVVLSLPPALNLRGVTAGPRWGSLLFAGSTILSVAVFAITAAPPASSSCATRHYTAATLLLLSAALVAFMRPHRTRLAAILTAALLALIGVSVALVGAATTASTHSYSQAIFGIAMATVLVSVGRTVHALWLWRTYDCQGGHTINYSTTEAAGDANEMNLVITAQHEDAF